MSHPATVDVVQKVLLTSLGIEERTGTIDAASDALGEIPELASLDVLELVTALEEEFDIVIHDEDFTDEGSRPSAPWRRSSRRSGRFSLRRLTPSGEEVAR